MAINIIVPVLLIYTYVFILLFYEWMQNVFQRTFIDLISVSQILFFFLMILISQSQNLWQQDFLNFNFEFDKW